MVAANISDINNARFRFESHVRVELDGCWRWTAVILSGGYGQFSVKRRSILAHRYAYLAYRGPIGTGLQVCHKCDNRYCVNPEHMFLGTAKDNKLDAKLKGRLPTGDQHWSHLKPELRSRGVSAGNSKLKNSEVLEIRMLVQSGVRRVEIAEAYGINPSTIDRIVGGKTWTHIQE